MKASKIFFLVVGLFTASSVFIWQFREHITINVTPSMPLGFYWLENDPVRVGDNVLVCPPRAIAEMASHRHYLPKGDCPGGSVPVLKRVVAIEGDHVTIDSRGIFVNGIEIEYTQPKSEDSLGQKLPSIELSTTLKANQYLIASHDDPRGFDSRYFGVIEFQRLKRVSPLWTWDVDRDQE